MLGSSSSSLQNSNPIVYNVARTKLDTFNNVEDLQFQDELSHEPFTAEEIYGRFQNAIT